jgi:hypothetical protein
MEMLPGRSCGLCSRQRTIGMTVPQISQFTAWLQSSSTASRPVQHHNADAQLPLLEWRSSGGGQFTKREYSNESVF